MAISSVKIANFALSKIGTDATIESLTEDSSEANVCNLWFESVREQTLAAFNWGFAKKRATLAAHSEDPPDEWGYRYQYPGDAVKVRFIVNPLGLEADPIPFVLESDANGVETLLTNLNEATVLYTRLVTEPTFYSPWFIECFATILASRICFALTGKLDLSLRLEEAARKHLIYAPAMDAQEKQDGPQRDASHIRARD